MSAYAYRLNSSSYDGDIFGIRVRWQPAGRSEARGGIKIVGKVNVGGPRGSGFSNIGLKTPSIPGSKTPSRTIRSSGSFRLPDMATIKRGEISLRIKTNLAFRVGWVASYVVVSFRP